MKKKLMAMLLVLCMVLGVGIPAGATETSSAEDPSDLYEVTFNPNGGALKDGEESVRMIEGRYVSHIVTRPNGEGGVETIEYVTYRLSFDISEVVPVCEGYTFAGWYFSSGCNEGTLAKDTETTVWTADWDSYYSAAITKPSPSRNKVTLYAGWIKDGSGSTPGPVGPVIPDDPDNPVDPSVSQYYNYRFVTEDTIEIT